MTLYTMNIHAKYGVMEILVLSMLRVEILRHTKQVLTDNRRTLDGWPEG